MIEEVRYCEDDWVQGETVFLFPRAERALSDDRVGVPCEHARGRAVRFALLDFRNSSCLGRTVGVIG